MGRWKLPRLSVLGSTAATSLTPPEVHREASAAWCTVLGHPSTLCSRSTLGVGLCWACRCARAPFPFGAPRGHPGGLPRRARPSNLLGLTGDPLLACLPQARLPF